MANSISGNVRLVYGTHAHNETFNTTSSALTFANPAPNYSAGGGRATNNSNNGAALDASLLDAAEGLLLIVNINTVGALELSMDGGTNWDVSIPAGIVNLISVGGDHPVFARSKIADLTSHPVASFTTAGVITFDSAVTTAGTYLMYATANGGGSTGTVHTSAGPHFIMKTTSDASTTGTVYELDGTTTKDLTGLYAGDTEVKLIAAVDYRFTLTEA
jgi:hypothetical protein